MGWLDSSSRGAPSRAAEATARRLQAATGALAAAQVAAAGVAEVGLAGVHCCLLRPCRPAACDLLGTSWATQPCRARCSRAGEGKEAVASGRRRSAQARRTMATL
jgi:hypothetical protein